MEKLIKLFPDSTLRVTVIDKKGFVLFDSSVKDNLHLENHLHRPEIIDAARYKTGKAIRKSNTTHHIYYYLAQDFPKYYIRSALPYNVTLVEMLRANHLFIYFIAVIMLITGIAIYVVTRNITSSIVQLRNFTHRAEKEDIIDTEPNFPNDELGEISKNMVMLYRQLIESKNDVLKEREKLIKHLQISHEGLAIFSSAKKEILANSLFIQYTNIPVGQAKRQVGRDISDPRNGRHQYFHHPKPVERTISTGKKFWLKKNGYSVFSIQCFVFQDDSFEITINDVSVTEHDNELKRQLTQNISHELKNSRKQHTGLHGKHTQQPGYGTGAKTILHRTFVPTGTSPELVAAGHFHTEQIRRNEPVVRKNRMQYLRNHYGYAFGRAVAH